MSKSIEEILGGKAEEIKLYDLPMGLYLRKKDGPILVHNDELRKILQIGNESEMPGDFGQFYADPKELERLTKEADDAKGEWLIGKEIRFIVHEREIWVRDTCRAISHPVTKEPIGYLGYLVDVTEEVNRRRLFDQLPAGLYRLDKNGRVVMVNQALAEMLGYEDEQELISRPISELYADANFDVEFRELVENGPVKNVEVALLKKNGESKNILMSASMIFGYDGSYAGREGIIIDVTAEYISEKILNWLPVGIYRITKKGDHDIVDFCNDAFARILGFKEAKEANGIDLKELYQSREAYKQFVDQMMAEHRLERPILAYPAKMKDKNGNPLAVEVNGSFITDRNGTIVGRVGIIRDITKEASLWTVREDIGRTLHHYTSMLMMIQHTLSPMLNMLPRAPFAGELITTPDQAFAFLKQLANRLRDKLDEALVCDKFREFLAVELEDWRVELINDQLLNLKDYEERATHRMLMIPYLRQSASILIDQFQEVTTKGLFSLEISSILNIASDLERLCCYMAVAQVSESVLEMDHQVSALREYVTFQDRVPEEPTLCRVSELVVQSIANLQEFAKVRRVKIKYDNLSKGCYIKVQERQMVRAITNLIHNAIKYSWNKPKEETTVDICSSILEKNIMIEIENYGVPITKEEIEKELIFDFGYRGICSGERGRVGTGVGLHDARQVARQHSGDVTVTSKPTASGAHRSDDYSQPFLTTVTLQIPYDHIEEESDV
ncbi:MAG: PAS domain-containing sensor histidine kinase [candidate division Zixibacteria bacterium]|nr:PAS domain-containing sensor histidine kinase [candidate division Zixibacteria bacterium]